MHNNPYAPPEAEVSDPVISNAPPGPAQVRNACGLVMASLLFGLMTLLPGIQAQRPNDPDVPLIVTLVFVALFGGVTIWLVAKTYTGRNWARWALLAYLLFGWWLGVPELTQDFYYSPLAAVISAACIGMEMAAVWYLFLGKGAKWFQAER